MHDKQIRRRRAVLVLLVAISLILLTEYFGESSTSPLHGVQRGMADVLSPIQRGASKVFSPVRDITGWISSTADAKSENAQLKQENSQLRYELAQKYYNAVQFKQDEALLKLDDKQGMKQYGPVTAEVNWIDPSVWYDTIAVDRGSAAGSRVGDPVIGEGGLVGRVIQVGSGYSEIQLVTAPNFRVGAAVEDGKDDAGVLLPTVGNLSSLTVEDLQHDNTRIAYGQLVVTSGFVDGADPTIRSFAPPGIPIGTVSTQDTQTSLLNNGTVQVTPSVDVRHISVVQILTKPHGNG